MQKYLGHIGALFVMAVWGATFVNSKVLLTHGLLPDEILLLRFIQAYIILAIICHRQWLAQTWRDEAVFLGLGVFGGSLYFMAENTALIYSTTSNVSILVGSTPIATALLVGAVYRDERLNARQWLGTAIAFVGMTLIVLNGQLILHLNPLGDTLALAASATWAIYSLLMRKVMARYSTLFITRKVFFYGLITILPVMIVNGHININVQLLCQPVVAANLLFLGIIASTLCYFLWNKVLDVIGTVRATNYIYLQSLITMLVAKIVLDERITLMAIIGVGVLIVGLALVQGRKT